MRGTAHPSHSSLPRPGLSAAQPPGQSAESRRGTGDLLGNDPQSRFLTGDLLGNDSQSRFLTGDLLGNDSQSRFLTGDLLGSDSQSRFLTGDLLGNDSQSRKLPGHLFCGSYCPNRCAKRPPEVEAAFFTVVPDWICDVLSPSSVKLDRGVKADLYARVGVDYYWLVDPAEAFVEAFRRVDSAWPRLGAWSGPAEVRIPPFDAVELELEPLWVKQPALP